MSDQDDSTESEETGLGAASKERQSMYPDDGYVLVEIDMLKPPGKALTKRRLIVTCWRGRLLRRLLADRVLMRCCFLQTY